MFDEEYYDDYSESLFIPPPNISYDDFQTWYLDNEEELHYIDMDDLYDQVSVLPDDGNYIENFFSILNIYLLHNIKNSMFDE